MDLSIIVCVKQRFGSDVSCASGGGVELADRLEQELAQRGWSVPVKRLLCLGRCNEGPNIRIAPGGPFFTRMRDDRLHEVLTALEPFLPQSIDL
ncbi:MAG: (2Fe-2S) ferredoxin domain-containing protein [Magnetococcus sp. YQC-9]